MNYPNWQEEKELLKQNFQFIAGVDEVGRGAWAGPIVAAAVIFDQKFIYDNPQLIYNKFEITDSKKLTPKKREELFEFIIQKALAWQTAMISEKVIDQIGITQANILVMQNAIEKLPIKPDYILIDAIEFLDYPIPFKAIIKGDQKVYSIAAASIVAKVVRDRFLIQLHKQYPNYGFDQHKGYGTKKHYNSLHQYGPCEIHRKSYKPVKLACRL
ncbi:ribonuclease HII [Candidatus Kuenenbacteria bacterium]|nr:ribonuclease HII [Candidatus Kuenenbacteria bacterium]